VQWVQLCTKCTKEGDNMPKLIDLTGQQFGRLIVIKKVKSNSKETTWECKCECGNTIITKGIYLRTGDTKSCGCLAKEKLIQRNYKHGKRYTRLYNIWRDMIRRCENETRYAHEYYHDKGITVYTEWRKNFNSFFEWSVNNGYSDDLTIDRINTNGNYEPDNCRWVTMKVQGNNKSNNHLISFNNETHTLSEWGNITGIKPLTIRARIMNYHWSIKDALFTPVGKKVIK
jgi:hypothetical protein